MFLKSLISIQNKTIIELFLTFNTASCSPALLSKDCVFYDENKLRTAAATTTAHDDDLSEASSFHCAASSYQYYQWRKGCGRGGGKIHHVKSPQTFPVTESFYYDSDDDRPFLSDLMDVVVDDADDDQTYNNVLNHVTLFETI